MSDDTTGFITNLQRFSLHDGPGLRTTVFLQGCPLRCRWCHNPETQERRPRLAYTETQCRGCRACAAACAHGVHAFEGEKHHVDRAECVGCGACARACPTGALEVLGREVGVDEVLDVAQRDLPFYRTSGGGLTLSGGEPLAQLDFTRALLDGARARGLHTALDTCGHAPWEALADLLGRVDLWLYDLKHADPARHEQLTGVGNETIVDNLRRLLAAGATVHLRLPLIPGLTDAPEDLEALYPLLATLPGLAQIDLMPYHRLGEAKYARLGLTYPCAGLQPPSKEEVARVGGRLEAMGIRVDGGGAA